MKVWVDLHITCKNAETRTSIDTGEKCKSGSTTTYSKAVTVTIKLVANAIYSG